MALLFMEGWDWQGTSSYTLLARDHRFASAVDNSSYVRTATSGRISGNRLLLGFSSATYISYGFPTSNDTVYIGFAYYHWDNNGATAISTLTDGGTAQIGIYKNAASQLEIRRGSSTVLGASTALLSLFTWHYIVVKVKINGSTGTVEAWLNGVKEIDLTSQNTLATSNTSVDGVYFYENAAANAAFDDCYIGDTSGSDMTDQQGDCHIELVTANANGTTNNWTKSSGTNNYEMVDDSPRDDDTTYIYSSTVNDKDLFGCTSLTYGGTILAVQAQAEVRKEDAGNRIVKPVCRSSATEVDGAALPVNTSYALISDIYENDPNGGINWTESAVNAMEVGIKITS